MKGLCCPDVVIVVVIGLLTSSKMPGEKKNRCHTMCMTGAVMCGGGGSRGEIGDGPILPPCEKNQAHQMYVALGK